MSNLEHVKAQVRFGLSQLAETNSHHEFEHLCRHLARARICSNIIPATGPVSSGGDQGRDFETFKTYINPNLSEGTTFVGLISKNPIVFACSMQNENIQNKVKSDIKKIMSCGTQVESIYFFLTSGVPISLNHKLKDWTKENYSISLEIIDGQAISELLADREVFWIAEQYLGIPGEVFPRAFNEKDWYQKSLNKWKSLEFSNYNFADFHEVKTAIRHATFSKDANQDILFWAGVLEKFRKKEFSELRRKSVYEISVAKLRGLGTLENEEDHIREYFCEISNLERSVDLEDANNLLTYCTGAYFRNLVNLKPEELDGWHHELVQKVDKLLSDANKPGYKCSLLDIRGILSLYLNPVTKSPPTQRDVENAIEWWMKLADNVKDAPLFPLRRFADHLTDRIYLIGRSPKYIQLSQITDNLLSERYGNFVAAEKCRDRAIQFYINKNIIKAINQVHQSKVKWFSEETLEGSILSILLISKWYKELNLTFAAKYYALAAAFISINSSDPQIVTYLPRALIQAAACDHIQGSWLSYLHLSETGLKSYCIFSSVGDLENDELFDEILFNTTALISITKQISPQLFEPIMKFVAKWNINNCLEQNISLSEKYWSGKSVSEIWDSLEKDLLGRPFGDIGSIREVTWSELGVIWSIKWENNYSNTPICEQFIAILQILLADLSDADLCLMKTEVNIFISCDDVPFPTIKPNASNSVRHWKITLPRNSNSEITAYEKLEHHIVYLASQILFEISLLPEVAFNEQIKNSFKNGLSAKVFVGQSYAFLYRYFIDKDLFNEVILNEFQIPESSRQFRLKDNEKLPWYHGSIPRYSKKIVEEYLVNRYTNVIPPIKFTLRRLSKSSQFKLTLEKLRSDGWLDWQILASICAITVTSRVNSQVKPYMNSSEIKRLFKTYLSKPEDESDTEIKISEYTLEKLQMSLKSNMLSTLQLFGLEYHQVTLDFDGIEYFLRYRCNYWDDDIEHDDPFMSDSEVE